ncbi:MAG: 16S rRNA (adenine(1518)-N(6)/adenine(1519)-N(6))-dimethyltransferase RsmA [Oscillospiraceae bacterium]|nr:16S rRNA (adenine(1518)-N(6)/adenine(1519)-N(6))-dimethyltransferase RsmA [Oscillospiraceae bacterium]
MNDLTDLTVLKPLLTRHGFAFSKSLGQNFIINPDVCPKMAETAVLPDGGVLEIGPGVGSLTRELAKRAKRVLAIELDKRLIPVLKETLAGIENVTVLNGDAMKLDLSVLAREHFGALSFTVCANLPYYITSPLIMQLLENRLPAQSVTVMVQKEAAERLTAQPGTRLCGAITLAVAYRAAAKTLFGVGRENFYPAPKVDSAIIQLEIFKEPPVRTRSEETLFSVIKAAFGQRRKTLLNSLSAGLSLERARTLKALNTAGIDPTRRAETLTLEEFAELANELN